MDELGHDIERVIQLHVIQGKLNKLKNTLYFVLSFLCILYLTIFPISGYYLNGADLRRAWFYHR